MCNISGEADRWWSPAGSYRRELSLVSQSLEDQATSDDVLINFVAKFQSAFKFNIN